MRKVGDPNCCLWHCTARRSKRRHFVELEAKRSCQEVVSGWRCADELMCSMSEMVMTGSDLPIPSRPGLRTSARSNAQICMLVILELSEAASARSAPCLSIIDHEFGLAEKYRSLMNSQTNFVALRLWPPPRLSASLSIRRFSTGCFARAVRIRLRFDQVVLISERRSVDEGISPKTVR